MPASGASALGGIERVLRDLERDEQKARLEFDRLGAAADVTSNRVLARGRAYVRLARAGLLPVGDGFSALVDHAARLERLRRALDEDVRAQKRLIVERARLAVRLEGLRARLTPLRAERDALQRAEDALLAAADRQRAFEHAFNAPTPSTPGHTAIYGAVGPSDPQALQSGFRGLKGRLPFPITGRSEVRSARRSGSEGSGLEMRAPVGTAVRAVYAARVAFADTYADYGRTVILDHGDRCYTVTGNLGSVDVEVGQEIDAGTRIGSVGDSPAGPLIYVEVRTGTAAADPAEWFGL